jgi:hypothetical protein
MDAAVLLAPSVCVAEQITVNFLAVITFVDDSYCQCIPNEGDLVGDTLWGSYTYDTDSLDLDPASSRGLYGYRSAPYGIEIHHELYSWGSNPVDPSLWIEVQDSTAWDRYDVEGWKNLPDPIYPGPTQLITITLFDFAGNAISSDTLPNVPPNLDDWPDATSLNVYGPGGVYAIYSGFIWMGFGNPPTGVQRAAASAVFLGQNRPNPFSESTSIYYDLPAPASARITIYDVRGRRVAEFVTPRQSSGFVTWNGQDEAGRKVASGIYLYRVEAGGFSQTRKMVILR